MVIIELWKTSKPFVTGSLSGCAAQFFVQPLDMVKVRIQLGAAEGGSTSPVQIAANMLRQEGFFSMYQGISAALMRQVLYTGSRLGLYDVFMEAARVPDEKTVSFFRSSLCALCAGGIAAVVGNPADLSLIRMQADSMLPRDQRRGYRHVGHAFTSIVRLEGFGGLFKGALPTATRAMAANVGMLAFNTKAKDALAHLGCTQGGNTQVLGGAAIAGFVASFMALPFDYVKTQVQKMKPDPVTGELPFQGPLDCAVKQVKAGGPQRLWTGFPVFYFRIAPHVMLTLVIQDQLKKLWKQLGI
eukprot:gnl/MRDRNA2_/MRDRNA2_282010_c0_seq1.p1 gnl/MRDRNA2_/MRDRNA2_282010_c0~~gnl/MRDRNA2_/MRDRNA2_282010_c0_seq1.p1  ORF type:complete len:300 (-),score=39.56 gnl/MRDRNA2_/MRDRNA2_282010_c0_seq1:71-970(-)